MQKAIIIHDFMLSDKKLKGTKLLVYAFIYSFCQIPDSQYVVNWFNASKFLGISKSSYFDALNWLIHNNYLTGDFELANVNFNFFTTKKVNSDKISEMVKIAQSKWVK